MARALLLDQEVLTVDANKIGGLNGYMADFYGNDFTWFIAFVEDTYTAEAGFDKLNRVKIRIWGYHDFYAPIKDLPLAQVLMPTTAGGVHDQGSIYGMEIGSQVVGFWLDRHKQHPVVLGSLVGYSPLVIRQKDNDIQSVISFPKTATEGSDNTFAALPAQSPDEFFATRSE